MMNKLSTVSKQQKLSKKKIMIIAALVSLASVLFILFFPHATFAKSSVEASVTNSSNSISDTVKAFAKPVGTAAIMISGVFIMITRATREWAKAHILWVIAGEATIAAATILASFGYGLPG